MGFARRGHGRRVRDAVGRGVGGERSVRGDELAGIEVGGVEVGLVPVQNGAGGAVVHDVEVDHEGEVGGVGGNGGCAGEKARAGGDFWVSEGFIVSDGLFSSLLFRFFFLGFLGKGGCRGSSGVFSRGTRGVYRLRVVPFQG